MRPRARPRPLDAAQPSLCLWLIVFLHCAEAAVSEGGVYNGINKQGSPKSILENIQSYEITNPIWLQPHLHRRSANKEHPAEAQVLITAEGQELRLHLEKNEQLLAPGYQEIWYNPDGARKSSSSTNMGNCFYHGAVLGIEGSSIAVSTCSGLRGLISLNTSVNYLIEPVPTSTDAERHAVFRAESLHLPRVSCLHHHGNKEHVGGVNDFIHGFMSSHQSVREKRDLSQNMKYVELLIVADKAEFEKHGSNLDKTKLKLLEAANLVDKYYKALSIRVALIGLEVWTHHDMISVSDNPHSTLAAFLSWRRKQLRAIPNDNAQLITGKSFQGTTIGLAPLKAMCSDYQSGGVNTDHSDPAVGVAATMAHEMGHNFGMSHDTEVCCQAKGDGGCIMAAATGDPFPSVFNDCNEKDLKSYLDSGGGKCLFNLPNTSVMFGGQRCGNGYLEDGEECDCGEEEECTSPCCNSNNCTLKTGAECAHGVCCDNCKLKSPGVLCRAPSGPCDLPEYCDGKAESCPANFYLLDGTLCAGGQAYCYTGMCLTLEQQCRSLWGQDGRSAPDLCFEKVNEAGDMYGNCGKDLFGKYRSCKNRDAKCGKIQCLTSATKPIENNAVRIETTVSVGSKRIQCMGTHVYKPGQEDEEAQGDTLDPGLVMTGTKCGDDSICFNGECRNASFLRAEVCNSNCHGHGLCNNKHNCHCDSGWAPPWCDQKGSGGSVDSGPVFIHTGSLNPVILVLSLLLFVVLAAVGLWYCYRHKLQPLKTSAPSPAQSCSVSIDDNTFYADGHIKGHANPTFLLKKQESDNLAKSSPCPSPSSSTQPRHAIARPAVKPPLVPAYAAEQREQTSQPQVQPVTLPQAYTPTPFKSTQLTKQRRAQAPAPPSGPPLLPSLHSKSHSQPLTVPKPRPDPPNRPPPPCPVKRPSAAQHQVKGLQVTPNAMQKEKAALAPSTGQKKPNRT